MDIEEQRLLREVERGEAIAAEARAELERHRASLRSWDHLIGEEMARHWDGWSKVVGSTMSDAERQALFDPRSSCAGVHFTLWTTTRVYFPVTGDTYTAVRSVPRHPCDEATPHLRVFRAEDR